MKFIGTLIIDHDIVRTTSLFSKNCNSPVTFLDVLHTAWLASETTSLPPQNILVGAVCSRLRGLSCRKLCCDTSIRKDSTGLLAVSQLLS